MSINQTALDTFIANNQCCAVELAIEVMRLRKAGDFSWKDKYKELMFLNSSLESMMNLDTSDMDCLTDENICTWVGEIRKICNTCGC